MAEWKTIISECCPNCGSDLKVFSDCPENEDTEFEQYFYDAEDVRCTECNFKSALSVDGGEVWVQDGNIDELEEKEEQQ